MVHEDGSASELLRAQDVEDLLQKAYCDSSIAVLIEPLPDSQREDSFPSFCASFTVCIFNVTSKISQVLFSCIDFSSESFGITLLRPCPEISTHWLSSYQDDDIIPTNLKSRKWESFPASEVIRNLKVFHGMETFL